MSWGSRCAGETGENEFILLPSAFPSPRASNLRVLRVLAVRYLLATQIAKLSSGETLRENTPC
jgi:hypothetical protein